MDVELPQTRYWEDHYCEQCEMITRFDRNNYWYMVCIQCNKYSYSDELKKFYNPNSESEYEIKQYISRKSKNLHAYFINFVQLEVNKYTDNKTYIAIFKDFNDNLVRVNLFTDIRLDNLIALSKKYHIQLFFSTLCDLGQSLASKYWNDQFKIIENEFEKTNHILEIALKSSRIDHIAINFKYGIIVNFNHGIITEDETIMDSVILEWDKLLQYQSDE